MGEGGTALPWHVIRQEANGNRYRVAACATRAEAQKVVASLGSRDEQHYWVERQSA
ncbi:SPOR domain-containing protein [Streptomyces albidoflavus]|uniref:SPOR domain-containing protein n=1 Tax=Streptomyces albidoflavus TaxID=1886 RepID=UPI003637B46E|nr:SPOR domain-containing protein [Streptomyces albidoflavus]WTC29450.1 SPOR domain-containing protein [Streptomyces albidoflavus]